MKTDIFFGSTISFSYAFAYYLSGFLFTLQFATGIENEIATKWILFKYDAN